jgi:homoaconitase/3-isopropylmalate dehydratase large subunit
VTGQTIAEKVLGAHSAGGAPVSAGDLIDARVDGLMAINYQWMRATYERMGFPDGPPNVWDPARVFLMNEHVQPPADVDSALGN